MTDGGVGGMGGSDRAIRSPVGPLGTFRSMETEELIDRFLVGIDRIDHRVAELDEDSVSRAWLPGAGVGRWPIRVVIGHLADVEVVFAHRLRRVAAEPGCEIPAWDHDAFVDSGHYGVVPFSEGGETADMPLGASLATIHTLRAWLGVWLRSLPPSRWAHAGMHAERGPMSLKDLLVYDVWHLEHHAFFCNAKVAKLTDGGGQG